MPGAELQGHARTLEHRLPSTEGPRSDRWSSCWGFIYYQHHAHLCPICPYCIKNPQACLRMRLEATWAYILTWTVPACCAENPFIFQACFLFLLPAASYARSVLGLRAFRCKSSVREEKFHDFQSSYSKSQLS